jgi:hypothetical protein
MDKCAIVVQRQTVERVFKWAHGTSLNEGEGAQ